MVFSKMIRSCVNLFKETCTRLPQTYRSFAGLAVRQQRPISLLNQIMRQKSSGAEGMKVTICGAAGCTGQPLSLLLKQSPLLDEIALYDVCATCGCGMELSHVDTKCSISSYTGACSICDALKDARVVVIVARNQNDTFECNAPVITELAMQICNTCPDAVTVVATEPVECLVPLLAEIQRVRCLYNPRHVLGCVELNCVRANTVLADFLRVLPEEVHVPVIGGASPETMVPVFSAALHPCMLTQEQIHCLTSSIMSGNEAVCTAKGCSAATPCFAGAYAIARTVLNVVKGLQGRKNVVQCAYVDNLNTCAPDCQFFATEVMLGPSGVEKNLGIPELSKFENSLLYNCLPVIQQQIARAIWLVYTMCCEQPPPGGFSPGSVGASVVPSLPVSWNTDYPDEYLASICREITSRTGGSLCWRARDADGPAARVSGTHQLNIRNPGCGVGSLGRLPRSLRLDEQRRRNPPAPCCDTPC